MDGTIAPGDTFAAFLLRLLLRSPQRWWVVPALAWATAMFACRRRDNAWLKAFFLRRLLGGRSPDALRPWISAFVEGLSRDAVLASARDEIERMRAEGARLVLATASPDVYVTRLAASLGFDDVLCTRVAIRADGRYSGELDGGNCRGEAKKAQVEALLSSRGADLRDARFYSDHHSDLPLLRSVGSRFAVNPTRRLARAVDGAKIDTLDWRRGSFRPRAARRARAAR